MSAAVQTFTPAVSRRTWSARIFSLPSVLGLFLVSMLVFLTGGKGAGVKSLADPDIWWHLRNAGELLHTGHFIRTDVLSFTTGGQPWINFEWMADLPYYFAHQWFGDGGVYALMIALAGAIFVGMYALGCLRSGDCKASFFASFIGFTFITVSLGPRTLLFGWLFLVIELAVLWNIQRGRDYTLLLPPLFLLWINTHGSWLIGFVLMSAFFACGFVGGEWGSLYSVRWSAAQRRKFLLVTAASFALLFINPYGWRLVAYPLDVAFHQKGTLQFVQEWGSLDFHSFRGKVVLGTVVLMGILQMVRRRRWSLQDLVFAIIAVYGAVTYVRFTFLAGILLMPLLAIDLRGLLLDVYNPEKDRKSVNAVALAVVVATIAAFYPSPGKLHAGIRQEYPEQALPYLRSIAGKGRVFNVMEWGGYLAWNVPQMKDFMDSRVDIFVHEGVVDDYLKITRIDDSLALLDKYKIRYVLVEKKIPLAYLLDRTPGWKRSYADQLAAVYERVQ
jgi:hypothetical protein